MPSVRSMGSTGWALALFTALGAGLGGAVGCGTGYPLGAQNAKPLVMHDAEVELDCPPDQIRVEEGWGGAYDAYGCGRKVRFKASCYGVSCVVHKDDEVPVPALERRTPEETQPR